MISGISIGIAVAGRNSEEEGTEGRKVRYQKYLGHALSRPSMTEVQGMQTL